jgi:uncharacterized protein DUF1236
MRNRRTTFLAGIAALALIAGTGLAAAQETPQGKQNATQPHAGGANMKTEKQGAPGGQMGQNTQSGNKIGEKQGGANAQAEGSQKGKMGENESSSKAESKTKAETKAGKSSERMNESAEKGAGPNAKETGQHARETERGKKTDKEKFGESERKERMDQDKAAQGERKTPGASTAEERREGGAKNAQSRDERLHGLQGNASGVTFNDQQRTRIRETVINARGAPRVSSVDFDLAVGTAIPRDRVHIVPVPEYLVEIEPRWRGFRYFIYEDELVIVDPVDMRIVAVVPV